ncbi:MAG: GNAT family N-acetyltransferase [Symbiobacteriaceae bacterium]|nr:GNAT family N-acetyltransferase [Symbiobacteriaceae bacterium]
MAGQINVGGDDFGREIAAVAYFINQEFLRMGYATQAVVGFTSYLFDRYGYSDMNALVQSFNYASNRVMQKAGYTCINEFIKKLDGHPTE